MGGGMGAVFPLNNRITVHPSLILWLSILCYLHPVLSMGFLSAAAVHELGHYIALLLMGKPPTGLTLHGMGASMDVPGLGYIQAAFAYAAGPMFSLLLALYGRLFPVTGTLSLCLGLFNLLPICGLDGSGILENLLCLRFSPNTAQKTAQIVSLTLCMLILPAAVFLGKRYQPGLWLPALAGLLLLKSIDLVAKTV